MRKDDFLATLMMVPPKQKQEIKPFSQKTTREAFSVSLEGLKGVRSFVMYLHDWSTLPSPGEQKWAANTCAAVPTAVLAPSDHVLLPKHLLQVQWRALVPRFNPAIPSFLLCACICTAH